MNRNKETSITSISGLLRWPVFAGIMMLTIRSYAPFLALPYLAISRPTSNTVTITVTSGNPYNYTLQMSTNATGPTWVSLRTNYTFVAPVVFTNVPATNPCEFYRLVSPPR